MSSSTIGPEGPPRTMGRYELLFRIAAGGMAEVYAARVLGEAGFQKLVALKRMLPSLTEEAEFVSMFLDEARLAANISSPHVVQTLDLGRDSTDALYIVMELVVGVPLSRILREATKVRRAVPVGMAVELLAQAAHGLHDAHEATTPVGEPLHIVHRDVSPQNILVGIDGRARLTDFGVARAVMRISQTSTGHVKGKYAYCAPEQLRLEAIDRRADVFSLGVVAWEVFAGQRLFAADTPTETIERVNSMPILPLPQVRSRVPEGISAVVLRALDRDPAKRFDTAREFGVALREAAQQARVELPPVSEVTRFVKAAGGAGLRKMRANMQEALSQPIEVEIDSQDLHLMADDDATTGTGTAIVPSGAIDLDQLDPEHQVSGLLYPKREAPRRQQHPRTTVVLSYLAAAAAALAVGASVYFALR